MSKIQSVLTAFLFLILGASVSYLGFQYLALQTAWEQSLAHRTDFQKNQTSFLEEIESLKTEIQKNNQETLALKQTLDDTYAALKAQMQTEYLTKAAPLSTSQTIYTYDASTSITEARTQDLLNWTATHRYYLDEILDKALTLQFDNRPGALVAQVWPESVFEQMGLKAGDRLLSFNQTPITRTTDIKEKLLEPQNYKLTLQRNTQTLTVSYVFNETPGLDQKIRVAQVQNDSKNGVRVLETDNTVSPTLKAGDVIYSVNGVSVLSEDSFFETLEQNKGQSYSLEILRDGQNQQIDVALRD